MQKVALLLLSILLVWRASAASVMPPELVGEWIDSTHHPSSDDIQISADGTGVIYAWRNGDPRGAGIQCAYETENHTLTVRTVIQPNEQDGKILTYIFNYDPATKTLANIKGDWEVKKPFWKRMEKFLVPDSTLSPNHRYGVTVPVYYLDDTNDVSNTLVDVKTGGLLTSINAEVGYDCALNFIEVGPTRWSKDSSILLWQVKGKWMDTSLVLIKIKDGKAAWQLDLLKTAQQAILERTQKAAPKIYRAVKGDGSDYGSAYPDGFTVPVYVKDALTFPVIVHANLTANPKDIENYPNNLDSQLVGSVDENGKFTVTKFALTAHKESD